MDRDTNQPRARTRKRKRKLTADQEAPQPARDVPPGESWAFHEHRSLATAGLGLPPLSATAIMAAIVLRKLALAIERGEITEDLLVGTLKLNLP